MRAAKKVAGAVADRLLGLVVPHTVARAADCGYECCSGRNRGRYCCYYPGGSHHCGTCITYIDC